MTVRTQAVNFSEVVKHYPGPAGDTVPAVDGIDLSIQTGEIFSLLGPNGAGKTTCIEMMVGLRRPTSGSVRTLGLDPVADRDEIRRRVAVQPQRAAVFDQQSVSELLQVWSSFYDEPDDVDAVIAQMGLQSSRGVRIRKLSGGQQQRLLVGLALISRPQLLVLDEPSTGLDPNAREELWAAIRALQHSGRTVVLSTHSMEEAQTLSNRIAILDHGRLVALGTPDALVSRHAPETTVTFTVDRATAQGWLGQPRFGEVTTQEQAGGTRVTIRTLDSDVVLTEVGRQAGAHGIQVHSAGLDGVFRTVTGHGFHQDDGEAEQADRSEKTTAGRVS